MAGRGRGKKGHCSYDVIVSLPRGKGIQMLVSRLGNEWVCAVLTLPGVLAERPADGTH